MYLTYLLVTNSCKECLPSSALVIRFVVDRLTPRSLLRNCVWTRSVLLSSHLFQSMLVYAPHSSLPYRSIGWIHASNTFKTVFIGKELKGSLDRSAYKPLVTLALRSSIVGANEHFLLLIVIPRYLNVLVFSSTILLI